MARTKIMKSAGRFGVRYGQSARRRTAAIESKQKQKQKCPFCGGRAKRTSKGIWNCKRCGKRFAGHAYYLEYSADSQAKSDAIKLSQEKPKAKVLKSTK